MDGRNAIPSLQPDPFPIDQKGHVLAAVVISTSALVAFSAVYRVASNHRREQRNLLHILSSGTQLTS